jgi:hypothetical protein
MKINLKNGIDELLFGMKQTDVTEIYGLPNKQFKDEDDNVIYVYNTKRVRLTFYEDEDFKLGYIICSNPDLTLFDKKLINQNVDEVKNELLEKGLKTWENEYFDLAENHFNESNWFILQTEFGVIANIEMGAIINDNDEFEWKFKK